MSFKLARSRPRVILRPYTEMCNKRIISTGRKMNINGKKIGGVLTFFVSRYKRVYNITAGIMLLVFHPLYIRVVMQLYAFYASCEIKCLLNDDIHARDNSVNVLSLYLAIIFTLPLASSHLDRSHTPLTCLIARDEERILVFNLARGF